ncbi:hypothetical protein BH20ACT5_BH20ACT5_01840 [soil metagenome]
MELHRPQPRIPGLQLPDDRIAPADLGETAPVDVEGEDAFHLGDHGGRILDVPGQLDGDLPAVLPDRGPDRAPPALGGKGQPQ